jgi:hypothetical protein
MDVDSDSEISTNTCCDNPLHEELQQLVIQCEELHRQHHMTLEATERVRHLADQGDGITVHYQCEDRDFGEVLEGLHAGALEEVQTGGPVRFGAILLEALSFTTFPGDLKN